MNKMQFQVEIQAPKQKVWDALWQDETFREWAGVIDTGTYMKGELKEGNEIEFISAENGYGVTSLVAKLIPGEFVTLKHQADTQNHGTGERKDEWTGGEESYSLTEKEGVTTLTFISDVPLELEEYFEINYPKALDRVKELAERVLSTTYSQKYTIVQFFQSVDEGEDFNMHDWPLHATLADVFAVHRTDALMADLQAFVDTQPLAVTYVESESTLGEVPVWLLKESKELREMHLAIADILEKHGAVFNSPEFTREGYLPHVTKKNGEMHIGDEIVVNIFSLVDMFPAGDWQERRIIKTFVPDTK